MVQSVLSEREQNKLQILNHLMVNKEFSASSVTQKTGLSASTVSRTFKELREKNLIIFQHKIKTEKGRNPDIYSFNWNYGHLLHYYVTNSSITGYLADLSGTVLHKLPMDYTQKGSLDDFFSIIKKIKTAMVGTMGINAPDILAAGFSIPGVVNEESGMIYTVPDVYQLNNLKFFDYTEHLLEVPVIANNVSWLSAVGEKTRVYPFVSSLIYIVFTYMQGIGAGIIYNNELIKGGMHYAGEIGQTWFEQNYSLEEYSKGKGLYEHSASIQRLYDNVADVIAGGGAGILRGLLEQSGGTLTLDLLEQAAELGDKDAAELLDASIRIWVNQIINLNLIINPEMFVLGGTLSVKNQYVFRQIKRYLEKLKLFQPNVQLSVSGEDAQLYGGLQMLKEYVNENIIFKEIIQ